MNMYTAIYQIDLWASFGLGLLLTQLAIPLALRLRLVDKPGARKLHSRPVAYLGGAAIVLAIVLTLADVTYVYRPIELMHRRALWVMGISLAGCALGLADDAWNLSAKLRFAVQAALALAFCQFGYSFQAFHLPGLPAINLGWTAVPVTAFFMLALLNGFNMMDGSDGLAGSVAAVCGFNLAAAAAFTGHTCLLLIGLAVLGASLGFLIHNRAPARVYMGSAGTYGLGFLLSAGAVALGSSRYGRDDGTVLTANPPLMYHVGLAVLLLAWPALEVFLSVSRRALHGRKLSRADKGHLHHRLLALGLGPGWVSGIAAGFSLLCGLMVLAFLNQQKGVVSVLSLLAATLVGLGLAFLGYLDFLKPGLLRARRPHYMIASHFLAMQSLKLETVTTLEQALALVSQACHELGCLHCRVVMPARREGGRPWVWAWKSVAPGSAGATDRKRLDQRQGSATWVLRSGLGGEEMGLESRLLMAEFMEKALPRVRELYAQSGVAERMLASAVPFDEEQDFLVRIWRLRSEGAQPAPQAGPPKP
jgi:UDP-GlcNAc:undecaprenyl-phosphate GlcNAc-1-phosphate transferase